MRENFPVFPRTVWRARLVQTGKRGLLEVSRGVVVVCGGCRGSGGGARGGAWPEVGHAYEQGFVTSPSKDKGQLHPETGE